MKKIIIIVFILILQNNFAQNGILDSSFGSGGLKTFSLANRNTRSNHLITFADNSFIVAGNSDGVTYAPNTERGFFITKYLSSGDLDASFGTNGVISIEGTLTGETFLTSAIKCNDGKVLLVCKINGISKFIKLTLLLVMTVSLAIMVLLIYQLILYLEYWVSLIMVNLSQLMAFIMETQILIFLIGTMLMVVLIYHLEIMAV